MIGYIWTRKSTLHDKAVYSLDAQLEACLARAQTDGVPIPPENIYRVRFSGVDLFAIPELDDLLRRIETDKKAPKVVYAYVQDRMLRGEDAGDIFTILTRFRRANTKLFLVQPGVELTGGDISRHIMTLIDGYKASSEIRDIKRRSWDGKRKRMEEGKIPGGGPEKYGFKRNKQTGKAEIVEDQAFFIRYCANLVEQGQGFVGVARIANEAGYRTVRGKRWAAPTIRRFFWDPAYKGEGYGWKYSRGKHNPLKARDQSDWIKLADDAYPAIIEPERWNRLHAKIQQNKGDTAKNQKQFALLRGLVYCAQCGSRCYYYQSCNRDRSQRYWYYACSERGRAWRAAREQNCESPRISAPKIEKEVWEFILECFGNLDGLFDRIRAALPAKDDRIESDLATLRKLQQSRESEIATLANRLRTASDLVAPAIESEIAKIESERRLLSNQIAALVEKQSAFRNRDDEMIELQNLLIRLQDSVQHMTPPEQRKLLESLPLVYRITNDHWEWHVWS